MVSGALELIWSDVRDESQSYIYVQHDHRIHIVYSHFRTHHESSIEYCYCSICTHDKIRRKVAKRAIERKKRKKQKREYIQHCRFPGGPPPQY